MGERLADRKGEGKKRRKSRKVDPKRGKKRRQAARDNGSTEI